MGNLKAALKHAFAVDPEPQCGKEQLPAHLERLAGLIVNRGLETPAIILFEAVKPLNLLASQALLALWPFVSLARETTDYFELARALEDRRTLPQLVSRIEQLAGSAKG